jgi:hypothetical protein
MPTLLCRLPAVLFFTLLATAMSALSQDPVCTPRSVPALCTGAKKIILTCKARDPLALRVSTSVTGCPTSVVCAGYVEGELATQPPVSVSATDASGQLFSKTLTVSGVHVGSCPRGTEDYREADRLRFVFGAATTVTSKLRALRSDATRPVFSPPIQVEVRDACGPLYTFDADACSTRVTTTQTYVKCTKSGQ